jgi:hypothetical protein
MSNGDGRKSHIFRIYKDDDPQSDRWIDVERLDELSYHSGRGYQYRLKKWKFHWEDFDPDRASKKQIFDPKDESGETWIEVPIRDGITVHESTGDQYQSNKHHYVKDASNRSRETHSRRVYNHEIKDEYLDADGQPPSDPEDYFNSLGKQDLDQYVEIELLDRYWSKENESRDPQGKQKRSTWQKKRWTASENDPLLQDPMLETDEADPEFVPVENPDAGPSVDPPWRLDPLQNIVNVRWGAGLAVEFGNNAGLSLQRNVPDLAVAVISFWFRFSKVAIDIADAEWDAALEGMPLLGIVPLLTWGITGSNTTGGGSSISTGPSYIGVRKNHPDDGSAHLVVRFTGPEQGTVFQTTDGNVAFTGSNYYAIGAAAAENHYSGPAFDIDNMKVKPDIWHHLLMSFDVSGPKGTMYIAIDDHNYTATTGGWYPAAPACMTAFGFNGGPHEILSTFSYPFYNSVIFSTSGAGFSMPEQPFGPPTPTEFASHTHSEIQLAELQIFTDFMVDTGDENIRRLFLDLDKGGTVFKPVNPKIAEEYFRIKPVVLLHGSSNWKNGKNTGSIAFDAEGELIADAQFVPQGEIVKFTPEPSIDA